MQTVCVCVRACGRACVRTCGPRIWRKPSLGLSYKPLFSCVVCLSSVVWVGESHALLLMMKKIDDARPALPYKFDVRASRPSPSRLFLAAVRWSSAHHVRYDYVHRAVQGVPRTGGAQASPGSPRGRRRGPLRPHQGRRVVSFTYMTGYFLPLRLPSDKCSYNRPRRTYNERFKYFVYVHT